MSRNSSDFERRLRRALDVPVPDGLVEGLKAIPDAHPDAQPEAPDHSPRWRYLALAAGFVLAAAVALLFWRPHTGYGSIEEYVEQHYYHDGPLVLERGAGRTGYDVEPLLSEFRLNMDRDIAGNVGFMMRCVTPAGTGLHFVVQTDAGPITVIIMPKTPVDDGERFGFDGMHAQLVALAQGSAAVIGRDDQDIAFMHDTLQRSILPRT